MSTKEKWKWAYKVVRSVLFATVAFLAFVFISLYILLSIPAVQNKIKDITAKELTAFLGADLEIGRISISPFNEVVIDDVVLYEPGSEKKCVAIDKLGAGISLWNLVRYQHVVITYAELIGLDAHIRQESKDSPLNIQFIIDAFAPKDKNKPPTKFDLLIHNVVIRKSKVSFDKEWCERTDSRKIDFNHLAVTSFNADIDLPRVSNDDVRVGLRRLTCVVNPGFKIETLSANVDYIDGVLAISDFNLRLPATSIILSDLQIPLKKYGNFKNYLSKEAPEVKLQIKNLTPSDFEVFMPELGNIRKSLDISLEAQGNLSGVTVKQLSITDNIEDFKILTENLSASFESGRPIELIIPAFHLKSSSTFNSRLATDLTNIISPKLAGIIAGAGNIDLNLEGAANLGLKSTTGQKQANVDVSLSSDNYGDLFIKGLAEWQEKSGQIDLRIESDQVSVGRILAADNIGSLSMNLDSRLQFDSRIIEKGYVSHILKSVGDDNPLDKLKGIADLFPSVDVKADITQAEINSYTLSDITLDLEKSGSHTDILLNSEDDDFKVTLQGWCEMSKENYGVDLTAYLDRVSPGVILKNNTSANFLVSGDIDLNLSGDSLDNLQGYVNLTDMDYENLLTGKRLTLDQLNLTASRDEEGVRNYSIKSDWIEGGIKGRFNPVSSVSAVKSILADAYPDILSFNINPQIRFTDQLDFNFKIFRGGNWADFLNLPVKLLYEAELSGGIDSEKKLLTFNLNAPYIQQGKDKLIQKTAFSFTLNDGSGNGKLYSSIPTKKGILDLGVDLSSSRNDFGLIAHFNPGSQGAFYGDISLRGNARTALNSSGKEFEVQFLPSDIYLNHANWKFGAASLTYSDKRIAIDGFTLSHDNQYLSIAGVASPFPEDEVDIKLQRIDLDYVFDTLNIEVAQFGGNATGEAVGRALLSPNLEAYTRNLHVRNLSYNDCVLGDGELKGTFDVKEKKVGIFADITDNGRFAANVDGGIWIGRDSLSFNFDADKVRVGFLQPFMKAFSSHVDGRASGKALLYGTFHDVNMKGRMFADSVAIKVDFTNVVYSGSDSIIIDPGKIDIRRFRLHDNEGHTGYLSGVLTHDYFHNPKFDFTISDARQLMLYDTNASMNQIWYGKVYGSGSGRIIGDESDVRIIADMTTDSGTDFTFVLNDTKEAIDYRFLTFTDKKRSAAEAQGEIVLSEPDEIVRAFNKKVAEEAGAPTDFGMDLRVTLTPDATMNLIMDPKAGDKITAHGGGAINMAYESSSNEMRMYGKYTLADGIYNFSLQDLILKDFLIKEGSNIAFNGDPMNAILDIRGAYRVNTNLTDLDASFATDKDLNRVNVPVDAMLLVTGEMEHPDIKFDIELPTLNSEVEQKVRSIISSEDMMNTQMIYLLALNRFYTPDYSNNGSNSGGEWASVASSTISSQLQNILGQLTDKVTVAPSLRSDKGDFSDLQVDVALSSRLFNNRLLINGNLGYRDPSTSSTTFIGDFDIEYLLNRTGNFRLKAYNHFNDQNYYLKSALTTQGLGVIWRKDFDTLFRRKSKTDKSKTDKSKTDHNDSGKNKTDKSRPVKNEDVRN